MLNMSRSCTGFWVVSAKWTTIARRIKNSQYAKTTPIAITAIVISLISKTERIRIEKTFRTKIIIKKTTKIQKYGNNCHWFMEKLIIRNWSFSYCPSYGWGIRHSCSQSF